MRAKAFGGAVIVAFAASVGLWPSGSQIDRLLVGFALVGVLAGIVGRGWPGMLGTGLGVMLGVAGGIALASLSYGFDTFAVFVGTLAAAIAAVEAMAAFAVVRGVAVLRR